MASEDKARVEVLKVWYSVFCTLIDAHTEGEYNQPEVLAKLIKLRKELAKAIPEVEHIMARHKQ